MSRKKTLVIVDDHGARRRALQRAFARHLSKRYTKFFLVDFDNSLNVFTKDLSISSVIINIDGKTYQQAFELLHTLRHRWPDLFIMLAADKTVAERITFARDDDKHAEIDERIENKHVITEASELQRQDVLLQILKFKKSSKAQRELLSKIRQAKPLSELRDIGYDRELVSLMVLRLRSATLVAENVHLIPPEIRASNRLVLLASAKGTGKTSALRKLNELFIAELSAAIRPDLSLETMEAEYQRMVEDLPDGQYKTLQQWLLQEGDVYQRFHIPSIVAYTTRNPRPQEEHGFDYYFSDGLPRLRVNMLHPITRGATTEGMYEIWTEEINFRFKEAELYSRWLGRQVPVFLLSRLKTPVLLQKYVFPNSCIVALISYQMKGQAFRQVVEKRIRERGHPRRRINKQETDELMTELTLIPLLRYLSEVNAQIDTSEPGWIDRVKKITDCILPAT